MTKTTTKPSDDDRATAERAWELSKYSSLELISELLHREWTMVNKNHYGHNVDTTEDVPYCTDCEEVV